MSKHTDTEPDGDVAKARREVASKRWDRLRQLAEVAVAANLPAPLVSRAARIVAVPLWFSGGVLRVRANVIANVERTAERVALKQEQVIASYFVHGRVRPLGVEHAENMTGFEILRMWGGSQDEHRDIA